MFSLEQLGWSDFFEKQWQHNLNRDLLRARISEENRGLYKIISERGEQLAELRGKLRHDAVSRDSLPAVGDWVIISISGDRAQIEFVFSRKSKFSRKVAGKKAEEQIVAANVDTILLVSSLNQEFNPRRIERYVTLAWDSGARPIVVLNKSDLCNDIEQLRREAEDAAMGVRVIATSIVSREGIPQLQELVRRGGTTALLGSSGVGKSSLVNAILSRELQLTNATREGDDKGRHTTTSRQLILVPGGGILLDTPGMRELQLWDVSEGISEAFGDIAELAGRCRFRDCTHRKEPGCAVRESIDAERLENYHKLQREAEFIAAKQDDSLRAQKTKELRKFMKEVNRNLRNSHKNQKT